MAGGMADQPYSLTRRMNAAYNTYTAMREFRRSKSWAEFQVHNPDAFAIIEDVMRLREQREKHG